MTAVPRAPNKHSMARLTADTPCHPGHTLPLVAPVRQEVARESRRPLSYIKKARMKGQGKVGHVGTCPGREPQTSPGGGPTTKPSNQEPTRSPRCPIRSRHRALGHQSPLSRRFLPYMGGPARTIKPFPTLTDSADSLYPADSLCFADPPRFLAYPPPGVLLESDHPIKGPDQRSIGVAPSSRGVSYT